MLATDAKEAAETIRESIARLSETASDRRMAEASTALKGPSWDIAALNNLVRGDAAADTSELDLLARVQSIPLLDEQGIAAAVDRLRSAERALTALAGTNAERSRERRNFSSRHFSSMRNIEVQIVPSVARQVRCPPHGRRRRARKQIS